MSFEGVKERENGIVIPQKYVVLEFNLVDGHAQSCAYPINFDEVYNLKGRLLTLVDATFNDREQRKAFKDMVWSTLREWMEDHVNQCEIGYETNVFENPTEK